MGDKNNPGGERQSSVQGMIDEMRTKAQRQRRDSVGVCPSCKRTIQADGSGHAPQCNHEAPPQQ